MRTTIKGKGKSIKRRNVKTFWHCPVCNATNKRVFYRVGMQVMCYTCTENFGHRNGRVKLKFQKAEMDEAVLKHYEYKKARR